jgi:hypothetical protein
VLKFIGDAMLATISFDERDEKAACRRALDAAVEASANLNIRNLEREAANLPFADVDIALHVGEGGLWNRRRPDQTKVAPTSSKASTPEAPMPLAPQSRTLAAAEYEAKDPLLSLLTDGRNDEGRGADTSPTSRRSIAALCKTVRGRSRPHTFSDVINPL